MSSNSSLILNFWARSRLPVLLQTEATECGLVTLAMVANYWGHRIDLTSMRRRFSISLKGATLKGLIRMAEALNLHARPLKLELKSLGDLALPCVLHWDMNHFVVLKSVNLAGIVIHDPAVGERRLPMIEVSTHFTGVALELMPGKDFRKTRETHEFSLLSLMGYVTGLKRGLSKVLILGLGLQVCALVAPFYMQWIVDDALVSADYDLITVLGIGFLLLMLLQAIISAVRSWITTALATDLNFQWLGNVFTHLMKLPIPYFEKRHLGDVVSRFGSIQTIQRSLTTQFVEGLIDGVLVIGTLIMMLLYSAQLTAVASVAVVLYALLRWSIFRSLREATSEQIIHAAKQQTHFLESARCVQSVRLFNRAEERRIGWMNSLADQFNADLLIARLSISSQSANYFLFGAERIIVIWLAALAVLDGRFSIGMLFAFISYKDQFSQRFSAFIDKLFELRMLHLHGDRVADIVLTEAEEDGQYSEVAPEMITPCIEIRNLAFRYSDGEPYILKDFSLTIPAGQCIAITGNSGCGKTTLIKLLLGLVEPAEGEILVGGIKIKQLGLGSYRKLVGAVMQDDQLFTGSIAENINFFDPTPNQSHVESCARLAAIHQDIMSMPMGYNTLVGGAGTSFSGGQRQRILLARALYKNPRILALDEATSHLDVWNEQLVNAAIQQIPLTRIIVAHRPETIAMAQRVIVLQEGKVVHDVEQTKEQQTEVESLSLRESYAS